LFNLAIKAYKAVLNIEGYKRGDEFVELNPAWCRFLEFSKGHASLGNQVYFLEEL
jgi:hypothetical protein